MGRIGIYRTFKAYPSLRCQIGLFEGGMCHTKVLMPLVSWPRCLTWRWKSGNAVGLCQVWQPLTFFRRPSLNFPESSRRSDREKGRPDTEGADFVALVQGCRLCSRHRPPTGRPKVADRGLGTRNAWGEPGFVKANDSCG
ncbi:hypothetical protein H6P81_015222 [Aristolochia fimbriata]|uniref:Uncharacterized protein n=1 Tax=Aristolochia fimbriata TaxID=158543 RepID=A0AAV7E7Z9_ARIFI|nr:hypothetical protein H6P81_015222 [Aristolochia fimbriata]